MYVLTGRNTNLARPSRTDCNNRLSNNSQFKTRFIIDFDGNMLSASTLNVVLFNFCAAVPIDRVTSLVRSFSSVCPSRAGS